MPPGKIEEGAIAREDGIEVMSFPLLGDGTDDVEMYARAVAAVIESDRRNEPVLVHCAAGTQRTGGVVACFRMLHQGWSRDDALREAERYGWRTGQIAMPSYLDGNIPRVREYLLERGLLDAETPKP
ncbi:MAG: dual specificity protein phosphatase family protein [Phycisphaerae bacterium]|nr:dual specificity protein phosphatase family protein [Phycisphaerae bacterium]